MGQVEIYDNASLIPGTECWKRYGLPIWDFGVYDKNNQIILSALHRSRDIIRNFPGRCRIQGRDLRGEYTYGGVVYNHFGHCLTESLGRLWALDTLAAQDGHCVLFHEVQRSLATVRLFARLLQINANMQAVKELVRVERLYVPEQLHSLNSRYFGDPRFYEWFRRRLDYIEPSSVDKVYVSRVRSPGEIVNEIFLEKALSEEGYYVMRPESASLEEQVSIYKSATVVLIAEGSTVHLCAMVANRRRRVGIVARRLGLARVLMAHLRESGLREAHLFNALVSVVQMDGGPNRYRTTLDYGRLWAELRALGFVRNRLPSALETAITQPIDPHCPNDTGPLGRSRPPGS